MQGHASAKYGITVVDLVCAAAWNGYRYWQKGLVPRRERYLHGKYAEFGADVARVRASAVTGLIGATSHVDLRQRDEVGTLWDVQREPFTVGLGNVT